MATLYLNHINRSIPDLREWLDGDWGLLLSHPVDFENCGFERDRWLQILRDEFRGCGVRPMAYRSTGGEPDRSWVSELMEDDHTVRLIAHEVIDIAARRLRDDILAISADRFILIMDDLLACRVVMRYSNPCSSPSPLDLLGSIDAIRRHSSGAELGSHTRRRAA